MEYSLTLIRLLLIPVVVLLAVKGQMTLGGITFILVCMTDLLDGYIARKYGMITKVGIWLDPVADKLMAISVIITFTAMGVVPLWVTITLFVKRTAAVGRRPGTEERQFHAFGSLWEDFGVSIKYIDCGGLFYGISGPELSLYHVCGAGACHFGVYTVCYH